MPSCDGQTGLQELAGNATMLYYMSEEGQEGRKHLSKNESLTSASLTVSLNDIKSKARYFQHYDGETIPSLNWLKKTFKTTQTKSMQI